mmetsp:Transcript_20071/g.38995  ORF Transcript_20071/g.38995 Transcript_20071/m.38995 type:complete len:172 (+) Transcript_20071:82-597(+)
MLGIGGGTGSAPSWLRDSDMRSKGVYLSGLDGSITKDRLEDFLESEGDAAVQEVVMVWDRTRKAPNGTCFVLFKDPDSVEKAMNLYNTGRATIYGSPFIICTLNVRVEGASEGTSASADVETRAKEEAQRKLDEKAMAQDLHAKAMEKQKNQKAAYGGSDMGMSHGNTVGR